MADSKLSDLSSGNPVQGIDLFYIARSGNQFKITAAQLGTYIATLIPGVSDGDKGAITVSGSGAVWDIDAGAVVFSKLDPSMVITAAETIGANNNDTTIPTSAAVKAYADGVAGGGVSDGDKGDIVVSSAGSVWTFDSSIVTAFSKTVLAGAAATNWRTTLGLVIGTDVPPMVRTPRTVSGTTDTLVLTDNYKIIECTNAAAVAVTVPPNSSVAFPVGAEIEIDQFGVGQVTVTAGIGVTINATPGLKLRAQYSGAVLRKRATDTWHLVGDLSA